MDLDFGLAPGHGPGRRAALKTPSKEKETIVAENETLRDVKQLPKNVQRPFPSGRISRLEEGLVARRLKTSELARLFNAVIMAEIAVLPYFVAHHPSEKDEMTHRIAFVIGLERAVQLGLINRFTICWGRSRCPKCAQSIRLFTPGGRRERARLLGALEKHLRQFVNDRKQGVDTLI